MFSATEKTLLMTGILVLVITLSIGAIMKLTQPEHMTSEPVIRFLDQVETRELLRTDADGYVRQLTAADLHARHVGTRAQYTSVIMKAATDFTPEEKRRIRALCRVVDARILEKSEAPTTVESFVQEPDSDDEEMMPVKTANDVFLENYGSDSDDDDDAPAAPASWNLDAAALEQLPWVFAKTSGSAYEDGLPHTRAPHVIFVSSSTLLLRDKALAKTLLHEKIHVYQRLHPEKTAAAIVGAGYTKTRRLRRDVPLIRANPDLDEWIYMDPKKREMALVYNCDTPDSINDVAEGEEHPYEAMAYEWEL